MVWRSKLHQVNIYSLSVNFLLFILGPNCISPFTSQEVELGDLSTRLLLHYSPKVSTLVYTVFTEAPFIVGVSRTTNPAHFIH